MPLWKNNANTSLWFEDGFWKIGSNTDTETWTTGFRSKKIALPCPESEDIKWKVKIGEDWINAGSDIKVLINPGKNCFIINHVS